MFVIGLGCYIGLTIIGIPYALPLGILAGLLEIVPNIGPVISSIPLAIISFGISPLKGLMTLALILIIHQSENYFLTPRIMQKSAGLSPIITLLALAVGFNLAGVTGAIISVPVVVTLKALLLKHYFQLPKN